MQREEALVQTFSVREVPRNIGVPSLIQHGWSCRQVPRQRTRPPVAAFYALMISARTGRGHSPSVQARV